MNSRLILVEGIPGAGKTTIARKIKEKLIEEGKDVILYEEGVSHPADMAWNAYLKKEEYDDFIMKCSEMWERSKKSISKEELIPSIVYIESLSVEDVIIKAANERKSTDDSRADWIDEIATWVSNMKFGKSHNLNGIEGVFSFLRERLRIDKLMIDKLDIPVNIIKRY